ncbi:MAG: D-glycero-beta-D-manno-heptose 1-phosphate adenylyltransferase, partial [Rhodospirillales bacterium]|nr:D-glycero-beta-D-manno-heptose 1-phosphate adenylyltransferase [Rhodospirillales bacterium]
LWRNQGLQIGFTNGCFDLLHPGHISTVAKAKAACDRLILGLNSDESVKRLKGKDRPIQSEIARAQVLASLENVDLVVIFSENTPANIIKTLKPEVLVKGADYKVEDIPEAAIVRAYGGKIHLAKLEKGHSTTATIAKMAK